MPTVSKIALVEAARRARENAVAPYSNFKVGAALLTADDEIVTGANVESVSYGLTCCAERIALFKALTEGKDKFSAIAVVSPGAAPPCGACRQLLSEYAGDAVVLIAGTDAAVGYREFSLKELLPQAFLKLTAPDHP